jgi:phosphate transport system substrate-binding protein
VFIESGENDDILISHLKQDHNSFGIFGFNFLITNGGIIKSVPVDGYKANFENISSKKYPLSRPLFIYFKKEHLKLFPEMKEFIFSLIDSDTIGKKGYLVYNGLVPLTNSELYKVQNNVMKELR